ncbi:prepilin-type N-terminal cleavage/methylation domain-containing protein [Candidatus Peregrinibacteria bacterium]|nr:prepilin-type N-terminal cleavage/methylation domain-containing protein [Candidatus Peregrinibacteria bacterium]
MSNKKGFTLIELLIVIVIIGILSVAVVPRVMEYPKKARDATRQSVVAALNTAMMTYLGETPTFAGATLNGCLADVNDNLGQKIKTYLPNSALPIDPKPASKYGGGTVCNNYYYIVAKDSNNNVTDYAFVAAMEVTASSNTTLVGTTVPVIANLESGTGGGYFFVKNTGL